MIGAQTEITRLRQRLAKLLEFIFELGAGIFGGFGGVVALKAFRAPAEVFIDFLDQSLSQTNPEQAGEQGECGRQYRGVPDGQPESNGLCAHLSLPTVPAKYIRSRERCGSTWARFDPLCRAADA